MKPYRVYLAVNRPMEALWEGDAENEADAQRQAVVAFERGECEVSDYDGAGDSLAGGVDIEEQHEPLPESLAGDGSIAKS